ncbi:MAG: autoinducer binding domain-containing protein [Boseongicola sp.]|nr:autoinducer binding domain-containing protein [Boseongicola sp.]
MSTWLECGSCPSEDDVAGVRGRLQRLTDDLGLDHFAYRMFRPPSDDDLAGFASYPREWQDRYLKRRYLQIDPVADVALKQARPFFWGRGRFLRAFRKQQRRVYDEAAVFGIVAGLTIPVRCGRGWVGALNVAASDARRLRDAVRCEHERLFAAAFDAHDAVVNEKLAAPEKEVPEAGLTLRERECLLWALEGKTAGETADILGLSVFTVNRHASTATDKLGCRNKHHAAMRAFRAGLL